MMNNLINNVVLSTRSDRVKCVDQHSSEPWLLVALFSGDIHVWDYSTQQRIKSFRICDMPVRAAIFVARCHWVIAAADNGIITVYNYNNLERISSFSAHADYVRSLDVHPTRSFLFSCGDDCVIKCWDWERGWSCERVFRGHAHSVTQIALNPKDGDVFASSSLDGTVKVWNISRSAPDYSLQQESAVYCVDYGRDTLGPYLAAGCDDGTVRVWDYQARRLVKSLQGGGCSVNAVSYHPGLEVLLSGSEDGVLRVWSTRTYKLEQTLDHGLERIWCISAVSGTNNVAVGYDEGCVVIKIGSDRPIATMDGKGRIVWVKNSTFYHARVRVGDKNEDICDGETLKLPSKEMGQCDVPSQAMVHSPDGRFLAVFGGGDFVVYTALALRSKVFGLAESLVWSADGVKFATLVRGSVKVFLQFEQWRYLDFGFVDGIYGGEMLGVKRDGVLEFYDWGQLKLVQRIEFQPQAVYWSQTGTQVCLANKECFFVLRYQQSTLKGDIGTMEAETEDVFKICSEVRDIVLSGTWVGDCFVYTTANKLNYWCSGSTVTLHTYSTPGALFLLGYVREAERIILMDRNMDIVLWGLPLTLLDYYSAALRGDLSACDGLAAAVPSGHATELAQFMEKLGYLPQALALATNLGHRFELVLALGDLKQAQKILEQCEEPSVERWHRLSVAAGDDVKLASQCYQRAGDYSGLVMLASCTGNSKLLVETAQAADERGVKNVAFLAYFALSDLSACLRLLLKEQRYPEALFFTKTYLPCEADAVVQAWKEQENLAGVGLRV